MLEQYQWNLEFSRDGNRHLAAGVGEVAGEDEVRGDRMDILETSDAIYVDRRVTTNGIAPIGGKVEPQEQKVTVMTKAQKT